MATSITVWTSETTSLLMPLVRTHMHTSHNLGEVYESISTAGKSMEETVRMLNDAFNRLVTLTMADTSLHIVAVIPLWDKDADAQIRMLCDACASFQHNATLHILGLKTGLKHIFEKDEQTSVTGDYKGDAEVITKYSYNPTFPFSYSLIDDYAANGAPIGFTLQSLAYYLALLQSVLTLNYYSVLSPSLISSEAHKNLSIGLSSLSLDKKGVAHQLLGMAFIAALDNVGINSTSVDAQKAAHTAENILNNIEKYYPNLYEENIKPLYTERHLDEGEVVAHGGAILDAGIEELKNKILSLLDSDTLTMPEKEAVLAMILGRDNENLSGVQYDHQGKILDDACEEPLNLYIDAFNKHCPRSGLLPVRNDFPALKLFKWDEQKKEFVESEENFKALNPLNRIKELKKDILNNTAYIRDKQAEIIELQATEKQREEVERIRNKWHKPEGNYADIEYKEQPLDDKYEPGADVKPAEAVDLRSFFSPIRNQRNLGSCTSFAVASMYEAMMSRNGGESGFQMSPAYLFYYSNVLKGRPEGGSNFFEQLEVLGKHGGCEESLFIYDANDPVRKPTAEADEDAAHHRVLAAKQIPLVNLPDKPATLKRNHKMLTSALTEGYPIGISLKVYDNLGKDGAFIVHPEDAPGAQEDGWHAMVIVGYSEENNFYIVRNSWGSDFGDSGYCYMPYTYIDDPDYMDFACIITEITDNADQQKKIPTVVANFAATETEIRIAAIRNAISRIKVDLKSDQNLYSEYYKYYQRLIQQLTMPNVQNAIRKSAEEACAKKYLDFDARKQELEDSFVAKIKTHKKNLIKAIIGSLCSGMLLAILYFATDSFTLGVLAAIFIIFGIFTWIGYKWDVKNLDNRLQSELDNLSVDIEHQKRTLLELQLKFHLAGMWINKFHKLSNEINVIYNKLISYNSTLREWQKMYNSSISHQSESIGKMFRNLDASPLLKNFFDLNRESILNNINLIDVFNEYTATSDALEENHINLREKVSDAIEHLMSDFNIVDFLLGHSYDYLPAVDIQEEVAALLAVGQPSHRNHEMNASSPVRILFANIDESLKSKWKNTIIPLFPLQPMLIKQEDKNSIILLTIHPINQSEKI